MNNSRKFKKVIKCTGCVLASFTVYIYLCMIFAPKTISDMGGKDFYAGKSFLAEPVKNSIDVLVLGNSDVYAGISPMEIYKNYGYTSYSSGAAWQTIDNINSILKQSLKVQKPKVAVLDVDCLFSKKGKSVSDVMFIGAPFIYHTRWKELKLRDLYTLPKKDKIYDENKGYINSSKIYSVEDKKRNYMGDKNSKPKKVKRSNERALDYFIEICKENNIRVLLLQVPNAHSWNYAKHNEVERLAKEREIEFIDLNVPNKDCKINMDKDYRDNGNHMNVHGATKVSKFLGDYLNKNYSDILEDRREDDNLNYWDKAVSQYIKKCGSKSKDNKNKQFKQIKIDLNSK